MIGFSGIPLYMNPFVFDEYTHYDSTNNHGTTTTGE